MIFDVTFKITIKLYIRNEYQKANNLKIIFKTNTIFITEYIYRILLIEAYFSLVIEKKQNQKTDLKKSL
jgi:hypothetical protein